MDKALKQRLVGASVLIILAVIILPMLLSGRSDTLKQESRQIELPPRPDELTFETRRFPIGVPNKPVPAPAEPDQETTDQQTTSPHLPAQQTPDSGSDQIEEPVEPPGRAVTADEADTGSGQVSAVDPAPQTTPVVPRYLVQVASFSSEKNANALADQLRAANMSVLMDVVDRAAGRLHRVRVGPFFQLSDAEAIVQRLQTQHTDLSPRVLDTRPDDSLPVSTPSDPLVRWVVQVGSFHDAKNAEALVARLRLGGLTAFSEQVTSEQGSVYKVRVGPEIDRDQATALALKVKTDYDLDGLVMTID